MEFRHFDSGDGRQSFNTHSDSSLSSSSSTNRYYHHHREKGMTTPPAHDTHISYTSTSPSRLTLAAKTIISKPERPFVVQGNSNSGTSVRGSSSNSNSNIRAVSHHNINTGTTPIDGDYHYHQRQLRHQFSASVPRPSPSPLSLQSSPPISYEKFSLPPPPISPSSPLNYRPILRHRQAPKRSTSSTASADPSLTLPPILLHFTKQSSANPSTLEPSIGSMPATYDHRHNQPSYRDAAPIPPSIASSSSQTQSNHISTPSQARSPPPPFGSKGSDSTSMPHSPEPRSPRQQDQQQEQYQHQQQPQPRMPYPIIHAQLLHRIALGLLTGTAGTQNPESLLTSPLAVRIMLTDNDAIQLCALPFFGSFTHRELTAQALLLVKAVIDASIEETVPYALKEDYEFLSRPTHRKKKRNSPQPRWWTRMENAAVLARMFVEDSKSTPKNSLWGYVKWGLEACWKQHELDGDRNGGVKSGEHIFLGEEVDWLLQVNSEEAWELLRSGSPAFAINARYKFSRTPTSSVSPAPQSPYPINSLPYQHPSHSGTASPGFIPQTPPYSHPDYSGGGVLRTPSTAPGDSYIHSPDIRRNSFHHHLQSQQYLYPSSDLGQDQQGQQQEHYQMDYQHHYEQQVQQSSTSLSPPPGSPTHTKPLPIPSPDVCRTPQGRLDDRGDEPSMSIQILQSSSEKEKQQRISQQQDQRQYFLGNIATSESKLGLEGLKNHVTSGEKENKRLSEGNKDSVGDDGIL